MRLKTFLGLLTASHIASPAWSFGTIVEVYPSTCPALPTGPYVSPTRPENRWELTGFQYSSIPPVEYLLSVTPVSVNISPRAVATAYLGVNDSTLADCGAAASFLVSNGQLSSNGQFVSTTGLVPYSSLAASSYIAAISTTFSIMNGSTLTWNNTAFASGHALFCVVDNTVEAVYNGQLPSGCAQVSIGYIPRSSCHTFQPSGSVTQPPGSTSMGTFSPSPTASVPGSIKGSNVTAIPVGCLSSSIDSPAVSGGLTPKAATTLEQCGDFCSNYAYFGVQSGLCVCGNTLASAAIPATSGTCNVACTGNSTENCGGDSGMAVYSIFGGRGAGSATSAMSTTEGPVTTSGGNSSTAATTATTSSVTSYVTSTGVPNCYDGSPFDNTVNGGYLVLCNTALPGFDLMTANGTNLAECIAACNAHSSGPASDVCVAVTFDMTASSNQCRLKNNIGVVNAGAEDLSEAAIVVTGAYATQIVFASAVSTMSSTAAPTGTGTSSTSTSGIGTMTSTPSGDSSATSMTGTSSSQGPIPTATNPSGALCPTYNGQVVKIGGSLYQVECSTDTLGDTLIGNTTTAASLAECGGYCNLYNLAIPSGCVGVTLLTTSDSSNCYLKSKITGTQFRMRDDSLRLIYPGYPTPADPILSATPPTGAFSGSFQPASSTGTTTSSSSSTGPTATGALCPAYNGQTLFFSSYGGANYEIECSTNFADGDLSPVVATSLTDCINHCSFVNVNTETPQCVGVTFLNTPQTSPPSNNCYPKGSVTTIVRDVPQDDSARLIFQGYPSATDMGISSASSTPVRPLSSTTSSPSGTQSTSNMQSALASSTVAASSASTGDSASSSASTSSTQTSSSTSAPSPTGSLCPTYDFQVIQAGNYQYEIECGYELTGHDIGFPYFPYPNIQTFQQCLAACNYWNENNATTCIAADFQASTSACYLKDIINERIPSLNINAARLIYSTYPSISNAVSSSAVTTTTTSSSSISSPSSISTTSSSTSSPAASTSSSTSAPASNTAASASTLATSTSSSRATSATADATASVYPAEPVCPVYNGGQLTSQDSNLYDIECNNDLRYAASNLPSSGILYAATVSACALACDQYNLNAGTSNCQGFTWDSTSSSTTTTNCALKSSLIQTSTINTANVNGVHSGRLLGPWPATNQVILSRPTPLVTNTLYNGYSITYDFATLTAPGGLRWQITEYTSPTLYVGAMGFLALSQTSLDNQAGLTGLSGANNNNTQPYTLPSPILPTYAVAAYWTRGAAALNTQQGIYYQVDTVATGRFFISIEFYYKRFATNDDIFHWITTYDTGNPGVWTSWHFLGGSSDDRGLYATVGHQGTQTLNGQTKLTIAAMYEHGQAGTVNSGDKIVFNTNPATNTVMHTPNAFDVARYGAPGAWSYTNSPV